MFVFLAKEISGPVWLIKQDIQSAIGFCDSTGSELKISDYVHHTSLIKKKCGKKFHCLL